MAEKWTKTSSPDCRWMNPKPLLALNHFTVPCSFNYVSLFCLSYLALLSTASSQKKDRTCGRAVPLKILKVFLEQQTQIQCDTVLLCCPINSSGERDDIHSSSLE